MIHQRLFLAACAIALLAGCNDAPADGGSASAQVLQGSISDAMLPVDRVRSEPPLEDPEAFAEAQAEAAESARGAAPSEAEALDAAQPERPAPAVPEPADQAAD